MPGAYVPPEQAPTSPPTTLPVSEQPQLPKTADEAKGGPIQTIQIQSDSNIAPVRSSDGSSIAAFNAYTGTFYRIKPDGTSEKRAIKTGLSDAINVEVTAGLKENEKVLEKPQKEIK